MTKRHYKYTTRCTRNPDKSYSLKYGRGTRALHARVGLNGAGSSVVWVVTDGFQQGLLGTKLGDIKVSWNALAEADYHGDTPQPEPAPSPDDNRFQGYQQDPDLIAAEDKVRAGVQLSPDDEKYGYSYLTPGGEYRITPLGALDDLIHWGERTRRVDFESEPWATCLLVLAREKLAAEERYLINEAKKVLSAKILELSETEYVGPCPKCGGNHDVGNPCGVTGVNTY